MSGDTIIAAKAAELNLLYGVECYISEDKEHMGLKIQCRMRTTCGDMQNEATLSLMEDWSAGNICRVMESLAEQLETEWEAYCKSLGGNSTINVPNLAETEGGNGNGLYSQNVPLLRGKP